MAIYDTLQFGLGLKSFIGEKACGSVFKFIFFLPFSEQINHFATANIPTQRSEMKKIFPLILYPVSYALDPRTWGLE